MRWDRSKTLGQGYEGLPRGAAPFSRGDGGSVGKSETPALWLAGRRRGWGVMSEWPITPTTCE